MNRSIDWKSYLGIAGFALLVAAFIAFRVKPDWKISCMIAAGLGIASFIAYIAFNLRDVKDALGGRTALYSLNTLLAIVIVLSILGLINFLSVRHHKRWDITQGKIHSLSDQSLRILQNLDRVQRDVEITAFFREGDPSEAKMRDLLEMYTAASHRLKVQFFDPAKSPGLAKRYNIEEYNTAVFSSKDKEAKIKGQTEEEITNALIQVSRDAKKTVYFLQGHGEASIDETRENGYSHIKEELEKENFIVKKLVLLNEPGIPHDCSVLVIAGPKVAITPQELKVINEYLVMAGRALFLADPRETTGLENFLLPWGVKLGNDVIIDRVARALVGSELMPVATQYEEHPLTRNFRYATAYPMARSVDVTDKNDHGAADTVIGRTSPQSWAETDLSTLFEKNAADFNADKDRQGPIPLIVAATAPGKMPPEETPGETGKKLEEKVPETRIVVIGCSQFPNNQYCSFPGNSNFLMNTIAWLAEEEDLISIRPSTQSPKTISLTREQASLVFYSSLFGLPGAVLIIGIVVWVRRRNR